MEYISVGTDKILEEYFIPVVNGDKKLKPAGGLWCSLYRGPDYNEWLDFISNKPIYLNNYLNGVNPYEISGAIITPKTDAKILTLNDAESFDELARGYEFDFEKVAEDYGAIYYDYFKLTGAVPEYYDAIRRYISVNTFLVLNPSIIQDYKKAKISISPIDYDYEYCEDIGTKTTVLPGTYQVEAASDEYKALLEYVCLNLKDEIYKIKLDNPNVPAYKIVYIICKRMMELYGEEIIKYCQSKKYNQDRVSSSIAVNSYMRTK